MIYFDIILIIFLLGFIFWVSSHLFSTIFHVPYVNSSDQAIHDALKLAGLKKGETLLDLGCGRGDALIIAARDFGAKAIGYEISPLPYLLARVKTFANPKIKVYCRDLKKANVDIKKADSIYLYLLNSVLDKIEDQIFNNVDDHTRVVSLAFKFPKHQPINSISTKNLGRVTQIYLYKKV
ncbi:MAG: class I SAM-dependent methyltransferase [Candidatus Berkelbacteria bacterium]|nr:class I SAM-dependent methyltransferase [Candidatus Berkelbacteria bacterium]